MKNWKTVKLGSLLVESKIESKNPDSDRRIRVKLNVGGIEKRPDTNDKEGATKYYLRKSGQFIFGKQNLHKGAFGIVPDDLDGFESSSDIPAFDVAESCYPEWIFYFFKQNNFFLKLESLAKGVGSKRIQPRQLFDLNIDLPEKSEQRKILDAVEEFEKQHSILVKEFNHQLNLINKLKVTSIQHAVEGKLTENWRNVNLEYSGHKLQKLIRQEKNQLVADGLVKKDTQLTKIKVSDLPFTIPPTWVWAKLGELIKDKPRNGYSPQTVTYATQTKSLKLGATTKGYFDAEEFKYIDVEIPDKSYLWLQPGDILVQRSNSIDYVGISALYTGEPNEFIYPDLMMKIQCLNSVDRNYILKVLSSSYVRNYFRSSASGTSGSMPKINQVILVNTLITLPPKEEQEIIVKKLDSLFEHYEKLERQINDSKIDLELHYQKNLSEVFGGNNNQLGISKDFLEAQYKPVTVVKTSENITLKNNETNMELEDLLKAHGKMSALTLWKLSKFEGNIDSFYEEVKILVEGKKTIKESEEKGYLELVK